ncbi:MAG: insulinase family protein, partial [Chloroflexi bacterium]|nr:insulinase family protein [Chloroflexota bacterium]
EVRLTLEDRVQLDRIYLSWVGAPRFDPDEAPLDVLVSILGEGHSSRLYRSLVYERQIARSVSAGYDAMEIAGEIRIDATVAPDGSADEVEQALLAELRRVREAPPAPAEVQRALNRLESQYVRQLESLGGFYGRANLLNYFNVFAGDPGRLEHDFDRYLAVTPADVQRVAERYLDERRVRLLIQPMAPVAASAPSAVDRRQRPGPGTAGSFRPPLPTRLQLANGLDLLVVEKRDVPTIATAVYVAGGALTDPSDRPGLASLASRLLTEGTTSRSSTQIADQSEFIAAHLNVGTQREETVGRVDVLSQHWPAAIDLLGDVLSHPAFEEREVERIRRERLTDLRRVRDEPNAIAERVTSSVLYGRTTPYGHPIGGREAAVSAMSRPELLAQHARGLTDLRPTVVVVGDVAADTARRQLEATFGSWTAGEPARVDAPFAAPPAAPTTIYLVDKPGAAQSIITAGQLSVPRLDAAYLPLVIVNMAFGGQFTSRLNLNLRVDKGYTYGYRSRFDWYVRSSRFVAGGAVQTAVTSAALAETLKEFRDLQGERPLTAEEFETAQQALIRGFPPTFETADQIAGRLLTLVHFGLPDDYYQTQVERLRSVSLADARAAAAEHIRPDQLSVVVVGDRAAIESELRQLDLPVVLLDDDALPVVG